MPSSELVDRHFEVALAGVVRLRKVAAPDVDLDRGDDELGQLQRGVARLAHLHELILAHAVADMDVVRPLLGDRRLPFDVASAGRVVVAHEKARLRREARARA